MAWAARKVCEKGFHNFQNWLLESNKEKRDGSEE